jgi:glycosyltransferase involved in cell wall biosynthesis
MKVLSISPYIYNDRIKNFHRNKTGFGMMVKDIIYGLSQSNSMHVITNIPTHEFKDYNVHYCSQTIFQFVSSFKIIDMIKGAKIVLNNKLKNRNKLKVLYYFLKINHMRRTIRELQPDIVHIHGIDISTYMIIEYLKSCEIPTLITLHGLRIGHETVLSTNYELGLERKFFEEDLDSLVSASVVSSGIYDRVLNVYNVKHKDNIYIIPNSAKQLNKTMEFDLKDYYNIEDSDYVLICVGNISKRKNQIQLIEAFSILPTDLIIKSHLFFLGNDGLSGELQELVNKMGLETRVHFEGFVSKNKMPSYYMQSDLNVVVSLDEGFGLSFIEAAQFGVPSVTFKDLDAIKDVYSKYTMRLVNTRNTDDLARTIEDSLEFNWDKNAIVNYSNNFTPKKMEKAYQELYERMIFNERWKN